uniref:H repeat-associated protein n=1 Tax=Escherichia coli TaxID=562 RepID=B3U3N0_ECOLX|nr:H repeat-associated protein [Escherichia coli]ACK44384.1 H repeat-associated protein [Escherichia coli]
MVILKMVFLFMKLLPELYPVSVLQNFTRALLTGCVIAILQMIKTSSQLMEKRSGILMTRVAVGERFMSLVRSQQCTVWSSDRSRRIRNPMRSQLSLNFLTYWILKGKLSQLMR